MVVTYDRVQERDVECAARARVELGFRGGRLAAREPKDNGGLFGGTEAREGQPEVLWFDSLNDSTSGGQHIDVAQQEEGCSNMTFSTMLWIIDEWRITMSEYPPDVRASTGCVAAL